MSKPASTSSVPVLLKGAGGGEVVVYHVLLRVEFHVLDGEDENDGGGDHQLQHDTLSVI